jgi:hypothetical protein
MHDGVRMAMDDSVCERRLARKPYRLNRIHGLDKYESPMK